MRWINEIIVHCSATKEGQDWHAKDIDKWHRDKGYDGIGYHFVIDLDGKIEQGRVLSRVGAHCLRHNQFSIGICYVGGLNKKGVAADTRTPAQKKSLRSLVDRLVSQYHCPVWGHKKFAAKACPCFEPEIEYADIVLKHKIVKS